DRADTEQGELERSERPLEGAETVPLLGGGEQSVQRFPAEDALQHRSSPASDRRRIRMSGAFGDWQTVGAKATPSGRRRLILEAWRGAVEALEGAAMIRDGPSSPTRPAPLGITLERRLHVRPGFKQGSADGCIDDRRRPQVSAARSRNGIDRLTRRPRGAEP